LSVTLPPALKTFSAPHEQHRARPAQFLAISPVQSFWVGSFAEPAISNAQPSLVFASFRVTPRFRCYPHP
jgi:hypothetical protein